MMRWFVALALLSTVLAGCINPEDTASDTQAVTGSTDLLARADPMWRAPQDFPHPAFGWPTLTNPPEGENVPEWWRPIPWNELPASIEGIEHEATLPDTSGGAGMAAFGSLVVLPTTSGSTYTVDISDPTNPKVLGEIEISTRGAAIIPYPDGRLVTVLATATDILVWDITDPTDPQDLGGLGPETGSHKVGVVPGTPIVVNANSAGGGIVEGYTEATATGVAEIYDLTDPENPELVQVFENGYGCHHIYFHNDPDRDLYRAYCAGIEVTQIWDMTDPRDPRVIVNVPVHHGNPDLPHGSVFLLLFSHFSIVNEDATVLIVGDETGGGAAPGCDAYLEIGGQSLSGPIGNLWFYDISDEKNPELLGWVNPMAPALSLALGEDVTSPVCTAHHGRLVPNDEGRDLLAMAFYGAGVVLVDFTDPTNPIIIDQYIDGANVWEVWHYNGWLITGDRGRGLDVLRLV